MITRLLFLVGVVGVGLFLPFSLFVVAALAYGIRFRAYELIVVGVVLDHSFGVSSFGLPIPLFYVVASGMCAIAGMYIRPYILGYSERTL